MRRRALLAYLGLVTEPPHSVLLVEDELLVLDAVRDMLRDLGAPRVLCARNGEEALGLLARHGDSLDMVVADWNMPKLSGLELLVRVRAVDPEAPFLMLTGRADAESVVRARAAGVTAYLRKPFSADQLAEKFAILRRRACELALQRAQSGVPGPDWKRVLDQAQA